MQSITHQRCCRYGDQHNLLARVRHGELRRVAPLESGASKTTNMSDKRYPYGYDMPYRKYLHDASLVFMRRRSHVRFLSQMRVCT